MWLETAWYSYELLHTKCVGTWRVGSESGGPEINENSPARVHLQYLLTSGRSCQAHSHEIMKSIWSSIDSAGPRLDTTYTAAQDTYLILVRNTAAGSRLNTAVAARILEGSFYALIGRGLCGSPQI